MEYKLFDSIDIVFFSMARWPNVLSLNFNLSYTEYYNSINDFIILIESSYNLDLLIKFYQLLYSFDDVFIPDDLDGVVGD